MTNYRYSINLDNKYSFGTEIEFAKAELLALKELFISENLPIQYMVEHKSNHPNYSMWYLDTDTTVSEYKSRSFYGGELSSRILSDTKECWIELKKICSILKSNNACVSNVCSNHITVDLSILRDERKFFEIFSKIIAIYEREIETFYMGDKYLNRKTKNNYASSLSFALLHKINSVNFQKKDFLNDLKFKGIPVFGLRDAINLYFYEAPYYKLGKTMEVRYPNGTINAKTIQNNINFTLKLIQAIENDLFDCEELTFMINKILNNNDVFKMALLDSKQQNFEKIVETISTTSDDIDDFMSQYEKVIETKKHTK